MTAATLTRAAVDWQKSAVCAGTDPDLYFPHGDPDSHAGRLQIAQALNVCHTCPVQPACLAAVLGREPSQRRSQVIGGRWFDSRGDPKSGPPPLRLANFQPGPPRPEVRPTHHRHGDCPECGRRIGLRADGTLRDHNDALHAPGTWPKPCPGRVPTALDPAWIPPKPPPPPPPTGGSR